MNELKLARFASEAAVQALVEQFALDLEGKAVVETGAARLEFPARHRFYRGTVRVRLAWERGPDGLTLRAETDTAGTEVSAAGRALLVLGAVSTLPWLLWWFFPSLLPLVPLSAIFVFLAWLGVARKPNFFEPGFFLQAMAARLRDAAED